jgi:hypothetical protein
MAQILAGIALETSQVAGEINGILIAAAKRDAALLLALSNGQAPEVSGQGISAARARYLGLAIRVDGGIETSQLQPEIDSLSQELQVLSVAREDLGISGFKDFNDRHQLRIRLFEAAFDAADPLGLNERWGYWEAVEQQRQVSVLRTALSALGQASPPGLENTPALWWPSKLAESLRSDDQLPEFTVNGLGWLPTGDSLIDVGSEPGPMAIGTLEKLGLSDPEHAAFLADRAVALNAALTTDPKTVRPLVVAMTERFDAMGHGSRYYNIKQVRSEAIRQLALAEEPGLALEILGDIRPLHNQDWACPNREGILLALEGRLLAESGRVDEAVARLDAAIDAAMAFLVDVDAAEKAGPGSGPGRTPPRMGGANLGGGPPVHGPPGTGSRSPRQGPKNPPPVGQRQERPQHRPPGSAPP